MNSAKDHEPIVLLAEDSDDDAFFFERAFAKSAVDCTFTRALNGKLAIDFLKQRKREAAALPVMLFLDLKMPVMNGFEVLEWLGSTHFAPQLRVVVLSGSNDQADRARAEKLGADDYLVKPITPDVLRTRVQTGLATWRATGPRKGSAA